MSVKNETISLEHLALCSVYMAVLHYWKQRKLYCTNQWWYKSQWVWGPSCFTGKWSTMTWAGSHSQEQMKDQLQTLAYPIFFLLDHIVSYYNLPCFGLIPLFVCLFVCLEGTHRGQNKPWASVFPFHHVGAGDPAQVVMLGSKCLDPVSHLIALTA